MNPAARKTAIAIIAILICAIGALWYAGGEPKKGAGVQALVQASSSQPILNAQKYIAGRDNLEGIMAEKLQEESAFIGSKPAEVKPLTRAVLTYAATPAALRLYGQRVAKALAPLGEDSGNPVADMLSALETKNASLAQSLLDASARDGRIAQDLLKIPAPQAALAAHLSLVNSLRRKSSYLKEMALILDNPVLAIQSADLYRLEETSFRRAVAQTNEFFLERGITFSGSEGTTVYVNN